MIGPVVLSVALAGVGLLGLHALREAAAGAWIVRIALGRSARPLAELDGGPAEVVAVARADEPVIAAEGERCVAVLATVVSTWTVTGSKGSQTTVNAARTVRRVASTVTIEDETGVADLDLDGAAFAGEPRRIEGGASDVEERFPMYAAAIDSRARSVVVREDRIEVGARVRVYAAQVVGERAAASAYRGASSGRRVLQGGARRGVVIALASEARLVLRALGPVVGLGLVGLTCLAYAAQLARLVVRGWF